MTQNYYYFCGKPSESKPALLVASWHCRFVYPNISCRHWHDHWVFDYTINPAGEGRVGGIGMPWKPREAHCGHLYPPQTPYWEKISGQVAGGFIIFDGGEVAGLRRLIRPPYGYAKIVDPGGRLEEPLERIAQAGAERGDSGYWEALGWCCRLFSLLGEASLRQEESYDLPTGEQPKTPLLSQKVQSYFRQHMAEPVRLEAVAAHLHLSPSSLSHRYRKETGESVMKTQQRMRIEQAKTLLLRGERLEIIARQTGFHDAFHLSRSFKQITCLSPSAFRLERGS